MPGMSRSEDLRAVVQRVQPAVAGEELLRAAVRTLLRSGVTRDEAIAAIAAWGEDQVEASLAKRGRMDLLRAFRDAIGNVTHECVADILERVLPTGDER